MSKQSNIGDFLSPPPGPQASTPKVDRTDGWANLLSGLGTASDKRVHTNYKQDSFLPKEYLGTIYAGDGLAGRIIDVIPDDITREWGCFKNDPTDEYDEGAVSHEFNRLKARQMYNKAKRWSRLMGGSLIYIGAKDGGSPQTSLKEDRIKSVDFLRVYDLGDIRTGECEYDTNPSSITFGQILVYKVVTFVGSEQREFRIHASRCIVIPGIEMPLSWSGNGSTQEQRIWGIPVLQRVINDIKDFRGVFGNVATILQEFIVGKYKFSDLDEMLSIGSEKRLQTRIRAIEASKSAINAVLLGSEEEYSRDSAAVTGISDLIDRFMMLLSAVTGLPVTKLFGRSAAGMNATGENDLIQYYDLVRAEQAPLTPGIERLGQIIMAWKGITGDLSWEWQPLVALTRQQAMEANRIEAEAYRTNAAGDQIYITAGVITPEQSYELRFVDKLGENEFEDVIPPGSMDVNDPANEPPEEPEEPAEKPVEVAK